ncbi:MAG: gliding motility protein GldL, partial [Paludibacter sp.]
MKLNKPNSPFYRWWNSYTGRRIVTATYSLGASVVIIGALFKILHLPYANVVLGVGMMVEAFIFALGVFDKPYREYDWSKIFDFKAEKPLDSTQLKGGGGAILKGEGV